MVYLDLLFVSGMFVFFSVFVRLLMLFLLRFIFFSMVFKRGVWVWYLRVELIIWLDRLFLLLLVVIFLLLLFELLMVWLLFRLLIWMILMLLMFLIGFIFFVIIFGSFLISFIFICIVICFVERMFVVLLIDCWLLVFIL